MSAGKMLTEAEQEMIEAEGIIRRELWQSIESLIPEGEERERIKLLVLETAPIGSIVKLMSDNMINGVYDYESIVAYLKTHEIGFKSFVPKRDTLIFEG